MQRRRRGCRLKCGLMRLPSGMFLPWKQVRLMPGANVLRRLRWGRDAGDDGQPGGDVGCGVAGEGGGRTWNGGRGEGDESYYEEGGGESGEASGGVPRSAFAGHAG